MAACMAGSYRTAGFARTMLACWAEMVPVESTVSTSQNMRLSPPPQVLAGSTSCFVHSEFTTSTWPGAHTETLADGRVLDRVEERARSSR